MLDTITTVGAAAGGLFATAGSGGVLGLVGSIVGGFFRHRQTVQAGKMKALEYQQELELQKLQIEARAVETEHEVQVANLEGSWKGLEESTKSERMLVGSSGWVQDVKALFRPFLTLLLVAITGALLFVLLTGHVDPESLYLDAATVATLVTYTVESIVFTTSTSVAWWFGDRSMQPPRLR